MSTFEELKLRRDFPDWTIRDVGAGRWLARHDDYGAQSAKGLKELRRLLEQHTNKTDGRRQ